MTSVPNDNMTCYYIQCYPFLRQNNKIPFNTIDHRKILFLTSVRKTYNNYNIDMLLLLYYHIIIYFEYIVPATLVQKISIVIIDILIILELL